MPRRPISRAQKCRGEEEAGASGARKEGQRGQRNGEELRVGALEVGDLQGIQVNQGVIS